MRPARLHSLQHRCAVLVQACWLWSFVVTQNCPCTSSEPAQTTLAAAGASLVAHVRFRNRNSVL